jgi:hypothetical protein
VCDSNENHCKRPVKKGLLPGDRAVMMSLLDGSESTGLTPFHVEASERLFRQRRGIEGRSRFFPELLSGK